MKVLSCILAILLLTLSCIPCSDAAAMSQSATEHHSQHEEHEHQDLCSPFCQCSCCAIACTLPVSERTFVSSPSIFMAKVFAAFVPQTPIGIAIPVWQPPKFIL